LAARSGDKPSASASTFSSASASRCTAPRACTQSFQMPAAENDSMSANIRLVTMTRSWIGSDFVESNPDTRLLRRTSPKITQHSKSARNTVAARRLGSGRFWRKSRSGMGDARDRG
jgi:hypothetical protein